MLAFPGGRNGEALVVFPFPFPVVPRLLLPDIEPPLVLHLTKLLAPYLGILASPCAEGTREGARFCIAQCSSNIVDLQGGARKKLGR